MTSSGKDQALVNQLKKVTVPIMHVAGWWDQEDFYGPVKAYEILEEDRFKSC
jgi:predicted acyl esterase